MNKRFACWLALAAISVLAAARIAKWIVEKLVEDVV